MGIRIKKGNFSIGQSQDSPVIKKDFLVRFFDYDGTILKEQWVYSGDTATAPTTPTHTYLTFSEWNNDLTNIDGDLDVGAIYNTSDGNTYIFITLTQALTGLTISLSLTKTTSSVSTINWGDGTTSGSTTVGNFLISHTYPSYNNYVISVSNLLGGVCYLGASFQVSSYGIFPSTPNIVDKVYFGYVTNGAAIGYQLLRANKSCDFVSLPPGLNSAALLGQDSVIKHLNLPRAMGFQQNMLLNNYACKYVTCNIGVSGYNNYQFVNANGIMAIPRFSGNSIAIIGAFMVNKVKYYSQQTTILTNGLQNCYSLEVADFPSTITTIGNTAFDNCYNLKSVLFRGTTPPTIGTTIFPDITTNTKIYVPDTVVDTYKTATGWIAYAAYIEGISNYNG